jgi:hypothetical protein
MVHIIRLRGAWDKSPNGDATNYARKFGRPRNLNDDERIWLVCRRVPGPVEVYLNERLIAESIEVGAFAADITNLIQIRNTILFSVKSSEPLGEVSIQIRTNE